MKGGMVGGRNEENLRKPKQRLKRRGKLERIRILSFDM
jgi:hypothetical protein